MAKISKDFTAGNLHPRETVFTTGVLGALNAEVIIDADGAQSLAVDLRGTFSMTIEVSGTIDGTNWQVIPIRPWNIASISYIVAITGTAAGTWVGKAGPFRKIRARVTAYTSGSATCVIAADTAPLDDTLQGMTTPVTATAVSASAGAAITLTIASPGAGLRHYLTYIAIQRINGTAAALTAAAGPVNITTTNIPGAMVIPFANDALAAGAIDRWREDFSYPIATSAQATATTIIAPVQTGVIWRITAGYYVAP